MSLVVFKLGGSLLDLPDVGERIKRLWETRCPAETRLLIVGGGKVADVVREWDARFHLGDEDAHELAVHSLRVTEELLDRMIPRMLPVSDRTDILHLEEGQTGLVSVPDLLDTAEEQGHDFPKNWEFTTDAISAWLANYVGAQELVLLKSADCGAAVTVPELSRCRLIDAEFQNYYRSECPLSWVNLRSEPPAEISIRCQ